MRSRFFMPASSPRMLPATTSSGPVPKTTPAAKPATVTKAMPTPKAATAPKKVAATPSATVPSQLKALAAKAAPATKPPTKPSKNGTPDKVEKTDKPKKPKLVRDSFTIPKTKYLALEELKTRSVNLARPMKKSELLRAGLMALSRMNNTDFLAALAQVPAIKTGRPKTKAD